MPREGKEGGLCKAYDTRNVLIRGRKKDRNSAKLAVGKKKEKRGLKGLGRAGLCSKTFNMF